MYNTLSIQSNCVHKNILFINYIHTFLIIHTYLQLQGIFRKAY